MGTNTKSTKKERRPDTVLFSERKMQFGMKKTHCYFCTYNITHIIGLIQSDVLDIALQMLAMLFRVSR